MPRVLLNPERGLRGGFAGRPGGWFVGLGLGWEVDSREHHAGEAFEATMARSAGFVARGLSLVHLTPRRVRELGAVTAEVLVAAADARAGVPEPAGLEVRPRGPLLPETPVRRRPGAATGELGNP